MASVQLLPAIVSTGDSTGLDAAAGETVGRRRTGVGAGVVGDGVVGRAVVGADVVGAGVGVVVWTVGRVVVGRNDGVFEGESEATSGGAFPTVVVWFVLGIWDIDGPIVGEPVGTVTAIVLVTVGADVGFVLGIWDMDGPIVGVPVGTVARIVLVTVGGAAAVVGGATIVVGGTATIVVGNPVGRRVGRSVGGGVVAPLLSVGTTGVGAPVGITDS